MKITKKKFLNPSQFISLKRDMNFMKHSVWSTLATSHFFILSLFFSLSCRLRQASINMEISLMEKRGWKRPVIKVAPRETMIAAEKWFATRLTHNEELLPFKRACLKRSAAYGVSRQKEAVSARLRINTRKKSNRNRWMMTVCSLAHSVA